MDVQVLMSWILWTPIFYMDVHVLENIVQSSNIHVLQVPADTGDFLCSFGALPPLHFVVNPSLSVTEQDGF